MKTHLFIYIIINILKAPLLLIVVHLLIKKINFQFDTSYFVELIDYWLVVKLKEENIKFCTHRVDFIDHQNFQQELKSFLGLKFKFYSKNRIIEIISNSIGLIKYIVKSNKLNFNLKTIFIYNITKNLIKILNHFFLNFFIR